MTDETRNPPAQDAPPLAPGGGQDAVSPRERGAGTQDAPVETPTNAAPLPPTAAPPTDGAGDDQPFEERLERLGGEPAPVITPEEFARLQRAGQVHIDAGGRVRAARRGDAEAGVSLRKRRAWYER